MRFLTLTFLGLLTSAALAEDVDKRLDAASDGVVSISNISGTVEIIGWSRNEVEVTGSLGKDVEELIFKRDGDEIEISVRPQDQDDDSDDRHHWHGQSISSDLVINVPENSSVEVVGVSADIDVQNVLGEQRLLGFAKPRFLKPRREHPHPHFRYQSIHSSSGLCASATVQQPSIPLAASSHGWHN